MLSSFSCAMTFFKTKSIAIFDSANLSLRMAPNGSLINT